MDFGFIVQGRLGRSLFIALGSVVFASAHATSVHRGHAVSHPAGRLSWVEHELKLSVVPGRASSLFGYSAAVSADGHTAIFGTLGVRNGVSVFTLKRGRWRQTATVSAPRDSVRFAPNGGAHSNFGSSVALSGDGTTALVGAPYTDAVYVYQLRDGAWHRSGKLSADDAAYFGSAVALDSTGATALVGADGTLPGGAAYLFRKPASGGWATTSTFVAEFIEPLGGPGGNFGYSLALDRAGTTVLVGDPDERAAYVYSRTVRTWIGPAKLTVRRIARSDSFAQSVALSGDGTTALIEGACALNNSYCEPGAAYVFTEGANARWRTTRTPRAKLAAPRAAAKQDFGVAVALSSDGETALVGATHEVDSAGAGAAYVFIKPASGGWANTARYTSKLTVPKEVAEAGYGSAGSYFGHAVALSANGTTALVGMPTFAARRASLMQ